uniref:Uncharacterized protein n=1 Tax=Anguilla anguilla TaxID=7936 RepID=A0A0E9RQ58_ANGAN
MTLPWTIFHALFSLSCEELSFSSPKFQLQTPLDVLECTHYSTLSLLMTCFLLY